MIDREQLKAFAAQNPQIQRASDAMEEQLMQLGASAEELQGIIEALEFVLQNPDRYAEVVQAAIQRGWVQEGQLPPEFNQQFIVIMLTALYDVEARLAQRGAAAEQQQFAAGGLAQLASMGRGGDTMLAHVNPREAEVLRRMGGSGSVNPNTGLREFKGGGIGSILSAVVPIGLTLLTGGAAAPALFGSTMLGSAAMGAGLGGLSSALSGGNFMEGALRGGITGGLGSGLGSMIGGGLGGAIGEATGSALSKTVTDAMGNAVVGGLGNMVQGGNFGEGALRGGVGSFLGNKIGGMGGESVQAGGKTFGNMLTAGYSPTQAALGGVAAGLTRNFQGRPSDAAAGNKPAGYTQTGDQIADVATMRDMGYTQGQAEGLSNVGGQDSYVEGLGSGATAAAGATGGLGLGKLAELALLSGALGGGDAPPEAQQAVRSMSPAQQEYFNRPNQYWNWTKMAQDAKNSGVGLDKYMALNWNRITGGEYNQSQPSAASVAPTTPTPAYARGGLHAMARLAQGGGSGRADTIDAKLSDGEYVFDAESVALLGDGSTKEGARRLEEMRQNIRKHKGKTLSKGKISPNARSPLAYMKEAA